MRSLFLLLACAAAAAQDRYPDEFFAGKVVQLTGKRLTLHYDFEADTQMRDFETLNPAGLLRKQRARSASRTGA